MHNNLQVQRLKEELEAKDKQLTRLKQNLEERDKNSDQNLLYGNTCTYIQITFVDVIPTRGDEIFNIFIASL